MKNIFKKYLLGILLLSCILLSLSNNSLISNSYYNPSIDEKIISDVNLADIKALALVGNGFGDAYFWVKDQMELWGCNFTTAGTTPIVTSCGNKPPQPITSDILVSAVDKEILQQFDCVYIPAGGHWVGLIGNSKIKSIIIDAYNEGLVISAICIGTKVLAQATELFNGVKVVYYSQSFTDFTEAGAKIIYSAGVVSDKRIVTATTGTCGYVNPYIYSFCVAIAKSVLKLSAVSSTTTQLVAENGSNTYELTVQTDDLSSIFYGNLSTSINSVKAFIYSLADVTNYTSLILTEEDSGVFTGNFTLSGKGSFEIELEVKSEAWGIEVVQEASTIKISGFELAIFAATITFLAVIIRRRKKN